MFLIKSCLTKIHHWTVEMKQSCHINLGLTFYLRISLVYVAESKFLSIGYKTKIKTFRKVKKLTKQYQLCYNL